MFGRCALRLCECIHLARKRGVLSRRSTAGSGSLVARHRQVHASCEPETGKAHKRRSAQQAHRYGVLGYKGARRKRLAIVPIKPSATCGPNSAIVGQKCNASPFAEDSFDGVADSVITSNPAVAHVEH